MFVTDALGKVTIYYSPGGSSPATVFKLDPVGANQALNVAPDRAKWSLTNPGGMVLIDPSYQTFSFETLTALGFHGGEGMAYAIFPIGYPRPGPPITAADVAAQTAYVAGLPKLPAPHL